MRAIRLEYLEQRTLFTLGGPNLGEPELLTFHETWGGSEYVVEAHRMSQAELERYQDRLGVADERIDYNLILDGHGTGFRPPSDREWKAIGAEAIVVDSITPLESGDAIPAAVDWSTSQYFPPIGNQGGERSCTAWAFGYYVKTFQEALEHGWDLSGAVWEGGYSGRPSAAYQDRIFSPDFLYHQINGGSDNGAGFYAAGDVIAGIGAATWSTMPNDPNDSTTWPGEAAWREAPIYRGSGSTNWMDVRSSVDALKTLLRGGNLAVMAVDAGDMYEMATLDNFDNANVNHAQTLVGYDDDWAYTEEGETRYGAFKVANSWGPTWSGETTNDGRWWISYEAMQQRVRSVYYMTDRIGYLPETVAVFEIEHAIRGDTSVYVGMGPIDAPLATKKFVSPARASDGDDIYPANPIVLDITEFSDNWPEGGDFFLQVFDSGSAATGTIESFSIERYSDYVSHVLLASNESADTSVATVQDATVYAETRLGAALNVAPTADAEGYYDNDTVALYDPTIAVYYLRNHDSAGSADRAFSYGPAGSGWKTAMGDWDGDAIDTVGLYDPAGAVYYLRNVNEPGNADLAFGYGPPGAGWAPVVGDWDGDGTTTVGLFDPVNSVFYLRDSNGAGLADYAFAYGPTGSNWQPVVGDWDGDGDETVGLYDPDNAAFHLRNEHGSGAADVSFSYGPAGLGWQPVVGDWNADGTDTVGLFDPVNSIFYLRNSHASGAADVAFNYGPSAAGWLPMAGDWGETGPALSAADGPAASADLFLPAASDARPILAPAADVGTGLGLTAEQLQALFDASLAIADRPGTRFGLAARDRIFLEIGAAGHGRFTDPMPAHDWESQAVNRAVRAD
jgi:hypothetical protein